MKRLLLFFPLFLVFGSLQAQLPIEITDQTLRINKEALLHFGFARGDEVTLSVREENGKALNEVTVALWPDRTIFADYKTDRLRKTIQIPQTGVYQFRIAHSGLGKRVCRILIERKAAPDQLHFSTTVRWVERVDTIYKTTSENLSTGYELKDVQKSRRVVASVDTTVEAVIDRMERVHSSTNLRSGNVSAIPFVIPPNESVPNAIHPDRITEVVSWVVVLATGEAGSVWYKDANNRAIVRGVTEGLVATGVIASGYGAIAILAIEGINLFSNPPAGENVRFQLFENSGDPPRLIKEGNSVAVSERIGAPLAGSYVLELRNDNLIDAINVDVKVVLLKKQTRYRLEYYTEQQRVPIHEREVNRTIKEIVLRRVPVLLKG